MQSRLPGREPGTSQASRAPARAARFASLLTILAAAAPLAIDAQPRPTRPDGVRLFAIENARVVTVSGATLDGATVVVDNGIITAVGRGVDLPAGAWVIDGAGKTVYPGLFDAFTTLGHGSAPGGGGFGGFGGPGGGGGQGESPPHSWGPEDRPGTSTWLTAADDIDGGDDRFEEWRGAGFTTVLTTLHAGLVPGQAAVLNLRSFDRPREMVVATPVAMRVNLRDRARTFSGYPGSSMGVLAYLKQLYYDAMHYQDAWAAYEADPRGKRRPEWDLALEPLRMQFAEGWPALFPADGRSDIGRALATTREMGVRPIVYGAQEAYASADLLAENGVSALVNLDWPEAPTDGDPEAVPDLSQLRRYDRAPTTPAMLAEAGVRFAFYSGGLGGPGEVLPAVRRAVAQGLAEDAAVRALTLAPAEIFGVSDRLGSIDEGKIANLVVTDGGLLDEETRVEVVFVDGEMFEAAEEGGGGGGCRRRRRGRNGRRGGG